MEREREREQPVTQRSIYLLEEWSWRERDILEDPCVALTPQVVDNDLENELKEEV